jgi:UDP-N-acetylmuramoyl-tripeptide--D-alanyl-D-alanine ligase
VKARLERVSTGLRDLCASVRWRVRDRTRHYCARLHRARLTGVTFIGVTGSAGKTTTKDLIADILSTRDRCQRNEASGNDHEIVDQTIIATCRAHRFSVVEMSATRPGYLDRSLRVVRPHIAVLTVIAQEHYGAYRSLEAVAAEKGKLIDALPADGIAVLNADDPFVRAIGNRHAGRIIWVGQGEEVTLRLLEARSLWPEPLTLRIQFEGIQYQARTRLHGTHLAVPVLSALGVAIATGLPLTEALTALARINPVEGRMQVDSGDDGITFIRDDHKTPQWSFRAPLDFVRDARATRKVVVIGSISDTTDSPSRRYAKAAQQALEVAHLVVLVGNRTLDPSRARRIRDDGSLRVCRTVFDAARFLQQELRKGDLVLLKGTNKQDHFVRLMLDRRRPVQCWEMSCQRQAFCDKCSMVYRPSDNVCRNAAQTTCATSPVSASEVRPRMSALASPIVIGLGNPSAQYHGTTHNVGQRVLEALANDATCRWKEQPDGLTAIVLIEGVETTLLKPAEFVNRSGPAIKRFLCSRSSGAHNCIVVLDDMDLTLGDARLKLTGGDGGHKGLRSIIDTLSTDMIPRIRIGVRRPGDTRRAVELVLANFSPDEEAMLAKGLRRAEDLLRKVIVEAARRSRTQR